MANHDNHSSGANVAKSKGPAIVAAIGAVGAVVLLVSLFMPQPVAETAPAASEPVPVAAKVEENIAPVAVVEVAEAAGTKVSLSGEEVVKNGCAMCHAAGLMNAPKIGDKAQWEPRIAQGYETIVKHAIEGIRTMPARGGNATLTDIEVARAVVNMANASGATFEEPKDAAPAEAAPADAAPAEVTPAG